MKGYIIYYNTWEKGTCVDVQQASHVFEAVVLFKRYRPKLKITHITEMKK